MLTPQGTIQVDKFYAPVDWQYSFPEGYTRLEYLQSSGTQYIDTGFAPTNHTTIKIKLSITSKTAKFVYGSRISVSENVHDFEFDLQTRVYAQFYSSNTQDYTNYNWDFNKIYNIENGKNGAYINGVKIKTYPENVFTSTLNIYLFGLNQNNYFQASRALYGKIYNAQIIEGSTLVRNFVPAKRNSDNKPGMYDLVNNVFYVNQGTGEFVMGEELYSNNSQIDIRQKNNTNFSQRYKFNANNELTWANPQLNLSGPVGYTKVGSPTIVDNVVNGFSSSNYLQTASIPSTATKIELSVIATVTNLTTWQSIIRLTNNVNRCLELNGGNGILRYLYENTEGTSSVINLTTITQNIPFTFRLIAEGTNLTCKLIQNGIELSSVTVTDNKLSSMYYKLLLGYAGKDAFLGSIDLKETYIKVNDKLWFYGKNYTSENYAPVPAGLNYNNTTTPSIGYVNTQTQEFTPAPEGVKFKEQRDLTVIPPEDNTITLLYGTLESHHLPSEYTELEYIQSSGTQWIDTGVANNGYKSHTVIEFTKIENTYRQLTGNDVVGFWGLNTEGYFEIYQVSNLKAQLNIKYNVEFEVTADENYSYRSLIVNGQTLFNNQQSASKPSGTSIYIFVIPNNTNLKMYAKVFSQQIWDDNGTLVRNFIPAKRNSDSEIGMYDTVYGVFYTNQGTGTFTAGTFKYGLFGLLTSVSSGTYDVYIDDVLYATTTSGTQTDIDFSTLGAEYVPIGTCTTPEELVLHKIVIKPTTSGQTLTAFRCARTSGASGTQEQGVLWAHFQLENEINLQYVFTGDSVATRENQALAVTAKNNILHIPNYKFLFRNANKLKYLPVLNFSNRSLNVDSPFYNNQENKRLKLQNVTFNMQSSLLYNNYNIEQIQTNNVIFKAYSTNGDVLANNRNLKMLPNFDFSDNQTFSSYNLSSLYPTKLDVSDNNNNTRLLLYGSSTYPMRGLRGLKVSNEAPFSSTSTPQIDVSYTGLDRDALVELFESMPYNVGYTQPEGSAVTITDGVASGFDVSNYLQLNTFSLDVINDNYEIVTKFTPTGETWENTARYLISWGTASGRGGISITGFKHYYAQLFNDGTNSINLDGGADDNINNRLTYVKLLVNNKVANLYKSLDGTTWTLLVTKDLSEYTGTYIVNGANIGTFYDHSRYTWIGSIDLNSTYIKLYENNEWIPWFTGKAATTKQINITAATGNNLIQNDTNNPVTIDSNGIASGFSSTSYLKGNNESNNIKDKYKLNFEIQTKITLPSTISERQIIYFPYYGTYCGIRVTAQGGIRFYIYSNIYKVFSANNIISGNETIWIKAQIKNNTAELLKSSDGTTWTSLGTTDVTDMETNYNTAYPFRIGVTGETNPTNSFNGSIDLENTYIKVGQNYIMKGQILDSDIAIIDNRGKNWTVNGYTL